MTPQTINRNAILVVEDCRVPEGATVVNYLQCQCCGGLLLRSPYGDLDSQVCGRLICRIFRSHTQMSEASKMEHGHQREWWREAGIQEQLQRKQQYRQFKEAMMSGDVVHRKGHRTNRSAKAASHRAARLSAQQGVTH